MIINDKNKKPLSDLLNRILSMMSNSMYEETNLIDTKICQSESKQI